MNKDIGFYVRKLDHQVRRLFHAMYNRKLLDECTMGNVWIADFLFENQNRDIFQKEIEERLSINRATASKMLKLMEEKELIVRTPSALDGRQKQIVLTEKGLALHKLGVTIREETEQELRRCLLPEEVEEFKRLCEKLIEGTAKNAALATEADGPCGGGARCARHLKKQQQETRAAKASTHPCSRLNIEKERQKEND